jgi:polysaccharide export outer membrane protein
MNNVYIIGSEDVLQIHIWKHPEISATVPVRSDGKISIPLLNDIQASGLTPQKLKIEIAKKMSNYIEEPTVSVIVEAINSLKVSVSGKVNAPGVYKIGRKINIIDAISLAGGLSQFADASKVKIVRTINGQRKMYLINYDAFVNGKNIDQDISIFPGDSVIVP